MMKTRAWLAAGFLTASGAVLAGFVVPWRTLDDGGRACGATTAGGTVFALEGTIGQFDAQPGSATGGRFTLTGGYWAAAAASAESDVPCLRISQVSGFRVLSWPEHAAGWILQKSTDLQQWHDTGGALTGAGMATLVPPDADQPKYFYRLRKP